MTAVRLERLVLPAGVDSPGAGPFLGYAQLANLVDSLTYGNNDHWVSPQVRLAGARSTDYESREVILARAGDRIAGSADVELPRLDNLHLGFIRVLVHPAFRRRGLGTRLHAAAEDLLRAAGRTTVQSWSERAADFDPAGPGMLPAATGIGNLPRSDPGVCFAQGLGYRLEQVERLSVLALPPPAQVLDRAQADAEEAAGSSYGLVSWEDHCPEDLVEQYARLRERMILEVPSGELDWKEERWDVARLREGERRLAEKGGRTLAAAARQASTGTLVGHTVLEYYPEKPDVAFQEDTLVLPGHRGHRLGLLLKVHNLRRLAQAWPQAQRLYTWNAEENSPMLAVNLRLGFVPAGYTGMWQKAVGAPVS